MSRSKDQIGTPRPKKIEIGVINITTHPHSPERYVELFYDTIKAKRIASYRGAESIMLGSFGKIGERDAIDGLWGNLYLFVEIDRTAPVLDMEAGEPIISQDGEITFPVPEKLKPNLKFIEFVFFPKGHRLFFNMTTVPRRNEQTRNISANALAKSLEGLFYSEFLHKKYGDVNVIAEKSVDLVDAILKIKHLTKLSISMSLPNGDDVSKQKKRVLDRLKQEKAKKYQVQITGDKDDGLKPSDETKAIMEIATSNGKISAEGYDVTGKVSVSTSDYPVKLKDSYHKKTESSLMALFRVAAASIGKFTQRK